MRKSSRNNLTRKVLAEVHGERIAQHAKWGEQNHGMFLVGLEEKSVEYYRGISDYFKDLNDKRVKWYNEQGFPKDRNCTWDSILLEEVYEALAETDPGKRRHELLQVAAVAVAIIEMIDRKVQEALDEVQ